MKVWEMRLAFSKISQTIEQIPLARIPNAWMRFAGKWPYGRHPKCLSQVKYPNIVKQITRISNGNCQNTVQEKNKLLIRFYNFRFATRLWNFDNQSRSLLRQYKVCANKNWEILIWLFGEKCICKHNFEDY